MAVPRNKNAVTFKVSDKRAWNVREDQATALHGQNAPFCESWYYHCQDFLEGTAVILAVHSPESNGQKIPWFSWTALCDLLDRLAADTGVLGHQEKRIFNELMPLDCKLQASREGSK